MATTATGLHADLDAFYASVEQLLDPSLRGKPITVGGGVVLAASYEAKAFGVRGGMPGRQARELCPQLIFVSGHFREYQRVGDTAIKVIGDFTPLVEQISIDEAFADVAGCTISSVRLPTLPPQFASGCGRRLGLRISVGVARTKHLAKIASQVTKPDGLVVVDPRPNWNSFTACPSSGLVGALVDLQKVRISPDAAFSFTDWTAYVSSYLAQYGSLCLVVLGTLANQIMHFIQRWCAARWRDAGSSGCFRSSDCLADAI